MPKPSDPTKLFKKGGEEKYRIYRTWRDFHRPQAVPLFYRRVGTVLLTGQANQLLASCSKDGMYLYVMELSVGNLHLPLYIGKSNAPSSRWHGGHVRQLIGDVTLTANTALYSSRKNLAPREINDLGCAKAGLVGHPNGYTQLM